MIGSGIDKDKRMTWFLALLPALILGSRGVGDTVVTLAALFMLYRFYARPETRWFRAPWFGAALLLWLSMLLGSAFALFPGYSFAQSLAFIRWPLFALCLSQLVFTSPQRLRVFERATLGWMLFIALDSIFQYVHGADLLGHVPTQSTRLIGPFNKEVPGIYSLRLYCMALVGLIAWRREAAGGRDLLPLTGAVMVVMLVFSLLAGERIVFLQFLGISLIAAALLIVQMRPPRALLAGLAGAVVAAGAGVALWAPRMVERTIVSFGDQLGSFQQTNYYKIFEAAGMLWEKRPLTGIGSRAYNLGCEQFHYAQLLGDAEGCAVHPHNIYLEWLTENGVIGLGLFVLMLVLLFRQVLAGLDFRRDLPLSGLVLLAPLAIFWPLMTSMSMEANNYSSIVWLTVGWALSRRTRAA